MKTVKVKVLEADTEEMAEAFNKVFQDKVTYMRVEASLVTAFPVIHRGAIFNTITIKIADMSDTAFNHLMNKVFEGFYKERRELSIS